MRTGRGTKRGGRGRDGHQDAVSEGGLLRGTEAERPDGEETRIPEQESETERQSKRAEGKDDIPPHIPHFPLLLFATKVLCWWGLRHSLEMEC